MLGNRLAHRYPAIDGVTHEHPVEPLAHPSPHGVRREAVVAEVVEGDDAGRATGERSGCRHVEASEEQVAMQHVGLPRPSQGSEPTDAAEVPPVTKPQAVHSDPCSLELGRKRERAG